ncbi:MAG TPA: FAD-binding oxidoreductase [bacterium]|nr:FAD-binding oxidoreductase [bacterium]
MTQDTGRGPTDTADVVVIGAGVVGASVAYHLARRGCRNVLVLERRDRPGLGSTGKASGGFRGQFTTDVCVRLSLLAREKLLRFRDEVGADPGYRPVGYVFMAKTPAQLAALRQALGVQRAAGLHQAREVDPGDIGRLSPAARMDGIVGGTWCPIDGYIVPLQIMRGYLAAAERLGARIEYGVGEAACLVDGGPVPDARRVRGVRTERGEVATRCVVNAAGPWAGLVARTAGVTLPVTPLRRQTALTYPFPALPDDTPMTINVDDKFHFRVLDGRALLLWPGDTPRADPFDTTFEPRWLDQMLPYAHATVPCLRDARIDLDRCLCGLYEMSPDKHVILGAAPGVEGLFLVNGSSGHGVMHSPALGHLVAEMILDGRAHTLDVHPLRPTRFDEGEPNVDTGVL